MDGMSGREEMTGRGAATVKNHWYSMVRHQRKMLYNYVIDEVIRTDSDFSCVVFRRPVSCVDHSYGSDEK